MISSEDLESSAQINICNCKNFRKFLSMFAYMKLDLKCISFYSVS